MKTIKLNTHDIEVTLSDDGVSGTITSQLKETVPPEDKGKYSFDVMNAGFEGIEQMILAAAIAGIDVTSTAFVQAVDAAVDAVYNKYG